MKTGFKTALLLIIFSANPYFSKSAQNFEIKTEFEKFKIKFDRVYRNEKEEAHRFQIFKNNFVKVLEHNQKEEFGHKLEINKFSDKELFELKGGLMSGFSSDLQGMFFIWEICYDFYFEL